MLALDLLRRYAKERGLSDLAIAERLGYVGNGAVSAWMRGENPIAKDKIERVADEIFRLEGAERDEFLLRAWLDHAPEWVQRQFLLAERDLAAARADLSALRETTRLQSDELAGLQAELARLRDALASRG